MKSISATLIVLGVALVVASWVLPGMVGGEQAWTEENAKQYQDASVRFHNAQHGHAGNGHAGHEHQDGESPELAAARQKYLEQKEKLERAQTRGQTAALALWWLGLAAAGAGVALHYFDSK